MATPKAVAWQAPITLTFTAGVNAAVVDVPLFVADTNCQLVFASVAYEALGTDGGGVTADIVKASDGVAIGAGTSMLATPFNLKLAINTAQYRRSATLGGDKFIRAGQRVGINFTGNMVGVAGLCVTVVLERLDRPNW